MSEAITTKDLENFMEQFKKSFDDQRQYKLYRYCPHQDRLVGLLQFPSECYKCDSEILMKHLQKYERPRTDSP